MRIGTIVYPDDGGRVTEQRGEGAAHGTGQVDALAALDRVGDAVFIVDERFVVGFANAAAARLAGRAAAGLLGRVLWEILPEGLDSGVEQDVRAGLAEQRLVETQVYVESLAAWLSVRAFPARDSMTVIARDVTSETEARLGLVASEQRFRLLAEYASDVVYSMTPDGTIEWSSGGVERVLGLPPEYAVGKKALDLIHPVDQERAAEHLRQAFAGDRRPLRARMQDLDGNGHWVEITGHPVLADGELVGIIGGWRDIQAQVEAEAAIAESEELYRLIAEHALDVVIRSELDGTICWVSPSAREVLGWSPDELLGTPHAALVHPDDLTALVHRQSEAVTAGVDRVEAEVRYRTKSGSWRWVRARGSAVRDSTGRLVAGIDTLRDIDGEVEAKRRLAFEADHDSLTGLANRSRILAILESRRPSERGTRALLCVGVDDLREINNAFTHTAGDRVLVSVAQRLVAAVGDRDQVSRAADNEFAVVVHDAMHGGRLLDIVTRLQAAAGGSVRLGQQEISVTVSIGIALDAGQSGLDLLRDASTAMRQARAAGGNRWNFADPHLADEARQRLMLQSGLRDALADGRIVAWYQPVVSLPDGTPRAYEALARWVQPDGSVVAPDAFIPVAERTDLILELDRAILRQALLAARALPASVAVAVNLSAGSIASPDLLDVVTSELAAAGVPPTRLHLEVTETSLLQVTRPIRRRMQALAARGVTWWVDDFGTGYSSLSHLRDMPVQGLKMDRSFTAGITADDPTHLRLAQGLAGLASGLGLVTVAEGVERSLEARLLAAQGWQCAQGWLFGRPAPTPGGPEPEPPPADAAPGRRGAPGRTG